MKKIVISLIIALTTMTAFAQTPTASSVSPDTDVVYRLFPTQNMWTFIKLNTRNGQMWQVQYSTKSDQIEVPLSTTPRVALSGERNGRFFLYPTQNMWTFILLDQVEGRVWQVQWSTKSSERMVIPIN
jgi:phenylpyruvate tautomerase PptA (4-oxalocrotonate tautomerase family)